MTLSWNIGPTALMEPARRPCTTTSTSHHLHRRAFHRIRERHLQCMFGERLVRTSSCSSSSMKISYEALFTDSHFPENARHVGPSSGHIMLRCSRIGPRSTDLSPIENMWSIIQGEVDRRAAELAFLVACVSAFPPNSAHLRSRSFQLAKPAHLPRSLESSPTPASKISPKCSTRPQSETSRGNVEANWGAAKLDVT